jgi:Rieske Fe-S protein
MSQPSSQPSKDPQLPGQDHGVGAPVAQEWQGSEQEKLAARPSETTRRTFLFKLAVGFNGLVGVVMAVPILGFLLGPVFKKRDDNHTWVSLGAVESFPLGETRLANYVNPVKGPSDGDTAKIACWVRRTEEDKFQVFAVNCAHLGCPVRWFAQSKLFLCPCHGGAYYEDGTRASGPPPRGLFEYQHRIQGGTVEIFAGEMPTLSNEACAGKKPLIQISPSNDDQRRPA